MQMISYIQEINHLHSDIESNENVQNIIPKFKKCFPLDFKKNKTYVYTYFNENWNEP